MSKWKGALLGNGSRSKGYVPVMRDVASWQVAQWATIPGIAENCKLAA